MRKKIRLLSWLGLLIPILISGFRYGVGTDYFNYVNIFNSHIEMDLKTYTDINGIAETGYFILEKVSYSLMGDARLVFLSTAFLTITFFYLGMKRYRLRYPGLIFLLYLLTIFPMTMNAVRQGVAVSIMFYAFTFILNKKPFRYLLITLFASLFHISALLLIPFYFVGRFLDVKKSILLKDHFIAKSRYFIRIGVASILMLLVVASTFALVLNIPGFEKYALYLDLDEYGANYIFYVRLLMLLVLMLLAKYVIFKGDYRQNAFLFAGAVIEVILLILGFTSPFIKRQALYFSPFLIMLLPNIIDIFSTKIRSRAVMYALCLIYGLSFFAISFLVLGQSDIIPYDASVRSIE
jgi:hypothetical protein